MKNIQALRTTISNGWTRTNRHLLKMHIGNEEYNTLKNVYTEAISNNIPLIPIATQINNDIFLKIKISIESLLAGKSLGNMPEKMRQEFCLRTQKLLDSIMPIFKNKEISFKNISDKFRELDLMKIKQEDELFKEIGFKTQKGKFKISDLVRKKKIGDTANWKTNNNFTSEVVTDNKKFTDEIKKLFGNKTINESELYPSTNNYVLKYKGKPIGYYSIDIVDNTIDIGNYVLYPEFRNSRIALNSILALRDQVIRLAQKSGIKKITTSVDASNPKLLGLYKRFGFEADKADLISYIDDIGKEITAGEYHLVQYIK